MTRYSSLTPEKRVELLARLFLGATIEKIARQEEGEVGFIETNLAFFFWRV